jgi:excisionase family DNA binding protein
VDLFEAFLEARRILELQRDRDLPLECYAPQRDYLVQLAEVLHRSLPKLDPLSQETIEQLRFGLSAEQLNRVLLSGNALQAYIRSGFRGELLEAALSAVIRGEVNPEGGWPAQEIHFVVVDKPGETEPNDADVDWTQPMTLDEIASRLGIHRTTAGEWLRGGQIRGKKMGRRWCVDRAELPTKGSSSTSK